jgi:hypothetical protein
MGERRLGIVRFVLKLARCVSVAVAGLLVGAGWQAASLQATSAPGQDPVFADAQSLFYNADYEGAASLALKLRSSGTHDPANDELRSSALLFQLRALLERERDKSKAIARCGKCPELMAALLADVDHGRALARTALRANATDETALFLLGKLDLNYVWLQLGLLGKRTGWDEYWEARRSLDAVLKQNPHHVRARVARAWIDYIVSTKMRWGTRWILGGGNKNRALEAVHEAANTETDFFSHAEARFALMDMHVRERQLAQATEVAQSLARDFPGNRELAAFLAVQQVSSR